LKAAPARLPPHPKPLGPGFARTTASTTRRRLPPRCSPAFAGMTPWWILRSATLKPSSPDVGRNDDVEGVAFRRP